MYFPEFDENGELVRIIYSTASDFFIIPIREMNAYEKTFEDFFKGKPNGTTVTYMNDLDDVLEVTKLGDDLFDAIHHLKDGGQEAVRKISGKFAVCEIFMKDYNPDTRTETNGFLFDNSDRTEITAVAHVDEKDEMKRIHVHLEEKTPNGDVKTDDRVHIFQNMEPKSQDNIIEIDPKKTDQD